MKTPTLQERLVEARRQLELADRRSGTPMHDAVIGGVMLAIHQIIDALEELHTDAPTDAPTDANDMINDYRARKAAWAEYIDRNREARQ